VAAGYVYVLSNPAMPGVVKIGRSVHGGASRGRSFYQTGVPEPFVLEFEIYTNSHEELEAIVHDELAKLRVNPRREFFKCLPSEAIEAVIAAYARECLDTGARLLDGYAESASIDLGFLAHKYKLHWADVFDAVDYLSEFAVRKAVEEMLAARARRNEALQNNG
jgi:hypothetical protein